MIDRIAIVVINRVIKDSDIDRDLRVTSLLNGDRLEPTPATRKQAANRLIDQTLIRREIEVAQYPEANPKEVEQMLAQIRKQRGGGYQEALKRYGVTEAQLKRQLAWQITVLHFIEQRFRPGVLVSDEDVQQYYQQHTAEFGQSGGKPTTLDDVRGKVEEQLTGERVNQQFFAWLEQTRKETEIKFHETELK